MSLHTSKQDRDDSGRGFTKLLQLMISHKMELDIEECIEAMWLTNRISSEIRARSEFVRAAIREKLQRENEITEKLNKK